MTDGRVIAAAECAAASEYMRGEPMRLLKKLTRRQVEVATWIAQDLSVPSIAAVMGVKENTVKWHRVALYKKLGVSSAVGVTRFAFRAGLVS